MKLGVMAVSSAACRFVVVQHGLEERRTPGNTLAVQPDKPFQGLSMFGTGLKLTRRVPGQNMQQAQACNAAH